MSGKETKQPSAAVTGYLVLYNVAQFFGWTALFGVLVYHLITEESHHGVFKATSFLLYVFQTGAILEVIHPLVGFVKTNVFLTFFQVMSRLAVTWVVCYTIPQVQDTIGVPMFLLAWSITEMIRYSFYAFNLFGTVPYFLIWCRYTFFIILYPIGVTGELLSIFTALPVYRSKGLYSIRLPNAANFAFDSFLVGCVLVLLYLPVFPQLYMHMFKQRGKALAPPPPPKKKEN